MFEFVWPVDKQQTLGHIEQYFVEPKWVKCSKIELSLHGLHGLHFGVTTIIDSSLDQLLSLVGWLSLRK